MNRPGTVPRGSDGALSGRVTPGSPAEVLPPLPGAVWSAGEGEPVVLAEGDGLGDGDLLGEGLGDGDLLGDGDGLGDGDLLGDGDGLGDGDLLGDGDGLGDVLGGGDGELVDRMGEGEGEGEAAAAVPGRAWTGLAVAAEAPSTASSVPAQTAAPPVSNRTTAGAVPARPGNGLRGGPA